MMTTMASPWIPCPWLLPLMVMALALFSASPVLGDQANDDLINGICSPLHAGDDIGFCKAVFGESVKGRPTPLRGLAGLVQAVAVTNASFHYLYVLDQLGKPTDEVTKRVLSECKDAYQIVSRMFQLGFFAFQKSKYQDTYDYEQKAVRAQKSCETTFETPPAPPVNLMAERNRQMRILIAMSLQSVSKLLQP